MKKTYLVITIAVTLTISISALSGALFQKSESDKVVMISNGEAGAPPPPPEMKVDKSILIDTAEKLVKGFTSSTSMKKVENNKGNANSAGAGGNNGFFAAAAVTGVGAGTSGSPGAGASGSGSPGSTGGSGGGSGSITNEGTIKTELLLIYEGFQDEIKERIKNGEDPEDNDITLLKKAMFRMEEALISDNTVEMKEIRDNLIKPEIQRIYDQSIIDIAEYLFWLKYKWNEVDNMEEISNTNIISMELGGNFLGTDNVKKSNEIFEKSYKKEPETIIEKIMKKTFPNKEEYPAVTADMVYRIVKASNMTGDFPTDMLHKILTEGLYPEVGFILYGKKSKEENNLLASIGEIDIKKIYEQIYGITEKMNDYTEQFFLTEECECNEEDITNCEDIGNFGKILE